MPDTQLPNEWGGKRVVTGLIDIRTQPNSAELVSDVIVYDLPPNNQSVLFSGNGCKLAQYKTKDYKRFFVAHSGDAISIVLNKRGKAELLYNHATSSYGSLKLRKFYRTMFECGLTTMVARAIFLFAFMLVPCVFLDSLVYTVLLRSPDEKVLMVLYLLINPITIFLYVTIYYSVQAKKAETICGWLKANCAPQMAVGAASQHTNSI